MLMPVDVAYIDTAIILGFGGLIVHWIRRVNKSFRDVEILRAEMAFKMAQVEAALHEHSLVSDQVWADVGRRLNRLEMIRNGGAVGH